MEYSNNWFEPHVRVWNQILPLYKPQKILEVGCYEGQSTCYLIELLSSHGNLELCCIDTWQGGAEHGGIDMVAVERRFDGNIEEAISRAQRPVNVRRIKSRSDYALCSLVKEGLSGAFDLVYVDGSHQAPDVLSDAVLCFQLLRVGGLLIFDDYLWGLGATADPLCSPKQAIDSFVNCFQRKLQIHPWMPNYQLYCRKISS